MAASGILTAAVTITSSQGITILCDPVAVTFNQDVSVIIPDSAINTAIASIATQNLSISHSLNAESEKLWDALGELSGTGESLSVEQVLRINESVRRALEASAEKEAVLVRQLADILNAAKISE